MELSNPKSIFYYLDDPNYLDDPKGSTVEYANAVVPQQDAIHRCPALIVLKQENNNNNNGGFCTSGLSPGVVSNGVGVRFQMLDELLFVRCPNCSHVISVLFIGKFTNQLILLLSFQYFCYSYS